MYAVYVHMPQMMMPMYFFFGYQCSLLFKTFNLQTPGRELKRVLFKKSSLVGYGVVASQSSSVVLC